MGILTFNLNYYTPIDKMSSRMDPRHYLSRSSSRQSQSQSDEDPSRQVDQETYQGDFATMDPAMQRQSVSSMTAGGRGMSEGTQGMQQGMQENAGHVPGDATGIDTDAAGHAAVEGRWKGYDGTIEPDDEYVEHSGGG